MNRLATVLIAGFFAASPAIAQVGVADSLLDANLASQQELEVLPGVDAVLAGAIIAGRPYLTPGDLDDVLAAAGLGDGQRAAIYGRLFRHLDLNTATDEEIMLIPGMTERMAHEFEEYRPYRSLVQFRREIGKYVDADEVARLEQYVFVPLNLNAATAEQLMTIPGMTERMVHEFEEYRPYKSIDQFRREIGKYVDADEVARLESYVLLD
jgi:DNA uptake protein ComE-like DNA-binding protein